MDYWGGGGGTSTYSCAKHGAHNLVESGTFFAQA